MKDAGSVHSRGFEWKQIYVSVNTCTLSVPSAFCELIVTPPVSCACRRG